ncbi:MAG: ribonuclease H-like domain-containing protein, partial [Anaerolineae bacterium]|nr:ribonuclease H-like domain-containing protein [Anaerolineae bacterium]
LFLPQEQQKCKKLLVTYLVSETLRGFQAVVSFNGRAFDLPLLATRFTLARMDFPLTGMSHLDLLFPARRLWRQRLASCALSSLEGNILGVIRESTDVPGWLIPGLYFEYLRTGDARPMQRVFYHNVQDVLSLVTLTARLCAVLTNPLDEESGLFGWDLHSLARWYEGLNMIRRAEETYRAALAQPLPADVRGTIQRDLSLLLKRQGRLEEAAAIWRELIQDGYSCTPWACVELAKYCEWTLQDYLTAAQMTRLAMDFLESSATSAFVEGELSELQHRLSRLERKMATVGQAEACPTCTRSDHA